MEKKITVHINGTNGRTFCGHKKSEKTVVLKEDEQQYLSNCKSCLWRLTEDRKYTLGCYEALNEKRAT